jgi:phosphopantetheine adenylyltransferase/dephospho-CoA kinase
MKKLTDLVWPEIMRLAQQRLADISESGEKIIILDAAVLIEAGWDSVCHEVWMTFVPREEVRVDSH